MILFFSFFIKITIATPKACESCPIGWAAPAGSFQCEKCDSGRYSSYKLDVCASCPPGMYGGGEFSSDDTVFGSHCPYTSCPHTWNDATLACIGAIELSKSECKFPTYDVDVCKPCLVGKYSSAKGAKIESDCNQCSPGRVMGHTGNIDATPHNLPSTKSTDCMPCDHDYYMAESGKIKCESCKAKETTTKQGQTVCQKCDGGQYMKAASATGSKECAPCPIGYMSLYGSDKCDICKTGTYAVETMTECKLCGAGLYLDEVGKSDPSLCKPCPVGTYSSAKGASGSEDCNKCSPGRASNKKGADGSTNERCVECKIAKFSSIEAATECKACPAGFTSKEVGSTLCEQCVGGSKIKYSLVLVSCLLILILY